MKIVTINNTPVLSRTISHFEPSVYWQSYDWNSSASNSMVPLFILSGGLPFSFTTIGVQILMFHLIHIWQLLFEIISSGVYISSISFWYLKILLLFFSSYCKSLVQLFLVGEDTSNVPYNISIDTSFHSLTKLVNLCFNWLKCHLFSYLCPCTTYVIFPIRFLYNPIFPEIFSTLLHFKKHLLVWSICLYYCYFLMFSPYSQVVIY